MIMGAGSWNSLNYDYVSETLITLLVSERRDDNLDDGDPYGCGQVALANGRRKCLLQYWNVSVAGTFLSPLKYSVGLL